MRELPAPVRAREARERGDVSIDVPDGERRVVGPFGDFDYVFRIAEVTRFEDLQELRLIPESLQEGEAVEAALADDRVWEEEKRRISTRAGGCGCSEYTTPTMADASARRSRQHSHLAELLASEYRRPATFNDPGVMLAASHIRRYASRPPLYLVGVAALLNIHVGKGSTLVMSPSVHSINCATITLEDDSRLRIESGYCNVTCDTLDGPRLVIFPGLLDLLLGLNLGTSLAENPIDPNAMPQDINAYKYLPGYSREHLFVEA